MSCHWIFLRVEKLFKADHVDRYRLGHQSVVSCVFIKRRLNVQSAHGKARTSEVLRRVEPCSSDRYSVKSRAGKLEALEDMG